MRYIIAKNGDMAIVSDEDFHFLSTFKWWTGDKASSGGGKYFFTQIKGKTIYMHRMIMSAGNGVEVDHINSDAADNRRENLRLATRSQNCVNNRRYRPKSGYRGVYQQPKGESYQVKIKVNGKFVRGGNFKDKSAAARRYDELAKRFFGEFAVLNFPQEVQQWPDR